MPRSVQGVRCLLWDPQSKGDKINSGYLTPDFSGAPKRAEMLHHPCILRDPQTKGSGEKSELAASPPPPPGPTSGRKCYPTLAFLGIPKQRQTKSKWLPHPYLLGAQHVGGNATSPVHPRRSPKKALPLPSQGPKRWRKCHITPAFGGIPKQKGTKSSVAASPLPSRGPKRRRKPRSPLDSRGSPNKAG